MENVVPWNAIRVFAVVGRLMSFSRAAHELQVTPSAVSHQIRALEDFLGMSLVRRERNQVTLTSEGRRYLEEVSDGLAQVSRATRTLKTAKGGRVIRLTAPLSLSALWLVPRITQFAQAYPDIAISMAATWNQNDVGRGQHNLLIRYGANPPPGFRSDKLSTNELFPVCSPKLLQGRHPLRRLADLSHHTLIESTDDIYFDSTNPGWQGWLRAANIPDTTSIRYLNFSPRCLLHEVVVRGLGVGLTRTLLAADSIANGEMVLPFGPVLLLPSYYYLLCPELASGEPGVTLFRDWVMAEAETSRKKLNLEERMVRDIPKRNSNAGQKKS